MAQKILQFTIYMHIFTVVTVRLFVCLFCFCFDVKFTQNTYLQKKKTHLPWLCYSVDRNNDGICKFRLIFVFIFWLSMRTLSTCQKQWPISSLQYALNQVHGYILYGLRFGTKSCTLLRDRKRKKINITAENLRHLKDFDKLLWIFCSLLFLFYFSHYFFFFIVKIDNKKIRFFFWMNQTEVEHCIRQSNLLQFA